jgi:hypothetical protein
MFVYKREKTVFYLKKNEKICKEKSLRTWNSSFPSSKFIYF